MIAYQICILIRTAHLTKMVSLFERFAVWNIPHASAFARGVSRASHLGKMRKLMHRLLEKVLVIADKLAMLQWLGPPASTPLLGSLPRPIVTEFPG